METINLRCDCGCDATAQESTDPRYKIRSGWFILEQRGIPDNGEFRYCGPRLERDLHFSSIKCLLTWTANASQAASRYEGKSEIIGSDERSAPVSIEKVTGLILG